MSMLESQSTNLTIAEAVKFLKIYSCSDVNRDTSIAETQKLRQALLMVAQESEWENIGICADNFTQGLTALKSYLQALGYDSDLSSTGKEPKNPEESVYIKFNTRKMSYYADSYTGNSRGVLVAMQGAEEAILGTYGYFPLDLFVREQIR